MELLEFLHISDIWTEVDTSLAKVIWSFYIGIVLAAFVMWYNQKFIGGVARKLLKREILSEEKAITVKEGGFKGFFVKRALRNEYSALRKVVYCTVDKPKLKKKDLETARFYIPEELKYRADVKFHGRNTSIVIIIAGSIAMFIMAVLCLEYIPDLVELWK